MAVGFHTRHSLAAWIAPTTGIFRCMDHGNFVQNARARHGDDQFSHSSLRKPERRGPDMKDGYRFVDCDMHIMEPIDLFDKYLDPAFKDRVTSSKRRVDGGSTGMRGRPLWFFDGTPTSNDGNTSQYNRIRGPLVSGRANKNVMFAVERGYDAESQVMGMELEGIDIAVLFPTAGLSFLARDNMDPQFSAAICRAYNDWLHDFCENSTDQLKMAAVLPIHDVNLACQELRRCVKELGAVGAFV